MSAEPIVALVGRRDEPTDGVADYCVWLGGALGDYGYRLETVRLGWPERSWRAALADLREMSGAWRGRWVLLQYTTLAWSRRGFPWQTPGILAVLRKNGVRCGVVFHDFAPLPGRGMISRVREYCQLRVLERLYEQADRAIFTVPIENIPWVPPQREKAVFIPVGSNFPIVDRKIKNNGVRPSTGSMVAVFGISWGVKGVEEIGDIACAMRRVQSQGVHLRLVTIGRGCAEAEGALRQELNGSGIEFSMLGLMPAEELAQALAGADVLLCVRGHVSSRRGSAIAGIVCGVPIVGYRGEETGFPITEAGVMLVNMGDREGLVQALAQVLTDEKLSFKLQQRSLAAAQQFFCWKSIAAQYVRALSGR